LRHGGRAKVIAVNAAMARSSYWDKKTLFYYPFDIVHNDNKLKEVDMYAKFVKVAAERKKITGRSLLYAQAIIEEAMENGRITPSQIKALEQMKVSPYQKDE